MERNGHKRNSFRRRGAETPPVRISGDNSCIENSSESAILENVDNFIDLLSAVDDKSSGIAEVPDFLVSFTRIMEGKIDRYNRGGGKERFMDFVVRISKLTDALSQFPDNPAITSALSQTSVALQRAMAVLEEEFRSLMEDSRHDCDSRENASDSELKDYAAYSPGVIEKMKEIASMMISAGYESECSQVYYIVRRNAIKNQLKKMELDVASNMDDVAKMQWEQQEIDISRWLNAVKHCSEVIFPAERKLGESVFAASPEVKSSLLINLFRLVVIQLLDFVEATTMAKRSAEKLFKFLDMYEALHNLIQSIGGEFSGEELINEVIDAGERIGECAACIFTDLENSIKSDVARSPVPGGAVHPLTRYVMNYLKYACEYKASMEKIFGGRSEFAETHARATVNLSSHDVEKESESPHNFETMEQTTPFSIQVVTVMDLLDGNLEKKSKLYRDPSLQNVFLMNNGRYILQKVKGSGEIREVIGDTWCRRRSAVVRQYHKNYQRETWNRVLPWLNHDGLMVNGKLNKPLLKERFKLFTATFDEIHRTQSAWVVSDLQLQSELRISISSVLVPAYRSFVGRFRQYFESNKQVDKYIKYQPEDIETLIEDLFEGNMASMGRRK